MIFIGGVILYYNAFSTSVGLLEGQNLFKPLNIHKIIIELPLELGYWLPANLLINLLSVPLLVFQIDTLHWPKYLAVGMF